MESEEKLYRHALYIDNDIENIHFHHFYASINPKMYYDCFNIYNCMLHMRWQLIKIYIIINFKKLKRRYNLHMEGWKR